MNSVLVTDNLACGLHVSVSAELSYWRHCHYFNDFRGTRGRWVIALHPSPAGREVAGRAILVRPAVVDDFGVLVPVGVLQ